MQESLQSQLHNLHQLVCGTVPTDPKVIREFGWTVAKQLNANTKDVDSFTCRQLLADCMRLPIERPSNLYSALLSAAIKVSNLYPEFHFASYLKIWGLSNLRPEDYQRQHVTSPSSLSSQATVPAASPAGKSVPAASPADKSFPSLAERAAKALAHSLLLHPEDRRPVLEVPDFESLLSSHGLCIHPMLVTRIKEATGKDNRKYIFVTLTSPEGIEVETISHTLQPSPLHQLPQGKRHYVNIGQLYDCLLRQKTATVPDASPSATVPDASPSATVPDVSPSATVPDASPSGQSSLSLKESYLSQAKPSEVFPTEIGYIESIDASHGHMHIYDSHSRHLVAPVLRFSREKAGDFIRFIPIIPKDSKFKSAIILATLPSSSEEVQSILRDIRIININKEKSYATWELINKESPITELLSPLQLSQGETSPTFTSGYLHLTEELSSTLSLTSYKALIYLKRGRDRQKRPHIALLFK